MKRKYLVLLFVLGIMAWGCSEVEPVRSPELSLTVKVGRYVNPDTVDINLGDSLTLAWTGRMGEYAMDVLTVHPASVFWGQTTVNGLVLDAPDSTYVANLENSSVYADGIVLKNLKDTIVLSFVLSDVGEHHLSRQVLVNVKDTATVR